MDAMVGEDMARRNSAPRKRLRYGGPDRRLVNVLALLLAFLLPGLSSGLAADAPAPTRLLAFGDSLTAGYGLPPEDAFPVKLQVRLHDDRFNVTVLNGGFSGDTSSGGLSRVKWVLADKPQYALVEFGANDALRGIDPALTAANLDKILARLKQAGVKSLLIGMRAPSNWGADYQKSFDAIYADLAKKYAVPLYPFFLDGVALDPALNQADGLHPNAKGVDLIVARVAPAVERLLRTK
jgi:acyl-CoA thioesterase-1